MFESGFNFEDIIRLYEQLDLALRTQAAPGRADVWPRDVDTVLEGYSAYSGHEFRRSERDFYEGMADLPSTLNYFSMCLAYEQNGRKFANIVVNSHMKRAPAADEKEKGPAWWSLRLVNECWTRFCEIKEAAQAAIREEFINHQADYPNANTSKEIVTQSHNMANKRFSFDDFNDPDRPLDMKVENAGEVLAMLALYPLEQMVSDRRDVLKAVGDDNEQLKAYDFFDLADRYKVPKRYVSIFLTNSHLDEYYVLFKAIRDRVI